MSKFSIFVFVVSFFTIVKVYGQNGPPYCDDYVKINGRYFTCNNQPFYPLICNYETSLVLPTNGSNFTDAYLAPNYWYGPTSDFETQDAPSSDIRIREDLEIVHKMGFNSIRTAMAPEFDADPNHCSYASTSLTQRVFHFINYGDWICYPINTDPNVNDNNRSYYFQFIRQILQAAHDNDLKVFLDCAYGRPFHDNNYLAYMNYLSCLFYFITTLDEDLKKTLVAYVVDEEPFMDEPVPFPLVSTSEYTKYKICSRISDVYDRKQILDPDHLITIGSGDVESSLPYWDQGILKIDFVSPHFYPFPKNPGGVETNSQLAVGRVMNEIYWLGKNCNMPWLIGESGFSAIDDWRLLNYQDPPSQVSFPKANGSLQEQKQFAIDLLNMVRNCGGAGVSWWRFQEIGWNEFESGLGLLKHGIVSQSNYPNVRKPVLDAFENYLDSDGQPPQKQSCSIPQNYYDGALSHYYNPTLNNYSGKIVDQYLHPIKDAILISETPVIDDQNFIPPKSYWYRYVTFTHEDGSFNIAPYNWIDFPSSQFNDVKMTCSGGSKFERIGNNWLINPNFIQMSNNTQWILNRSGYDYFSNQIVSANQSISLHPFNSQTVNNLIIQSGGSADVTARQEINVNEFLAERGSDVLIHISETDPDCNDYVNYLRVGQNEQINSNGIIDNNREIKINFDKNINFKCSPNPNDGRFTISLVKNENIKHIIIFDSFGRKFIDVHTNKEKMDFNLTGMARGIYILTIYDNENYDKEILLIQ